MFAAALRLRAADRRRHRWPEMMRRPRTLSAASCVLLLVTAAQLLLESEDAAFHYVIVHVLR